MSPPNTTTAPTRRLAGQSERLPIAWRHAGVFHQENGKALSNTQSTSSPQALGQIFDDIVEAAEFAADTANRRDSAPVAAAVVELLAAAAHVHQAEERILQAVAQ